jgi:hypothetical protein
MAVRLSLLPMALTEYTKLRVSCLSYIFTITDINACASGGSMLEVFP